MPDKTKPIELSGNPHVHKIATASLAGVIVGCLLSAIMVVFMTLLAWRICRRKRNKASTYEQIMTDHRNQQVANENGGIIATAVSMKQIPFTVPTQGPGQNSRRGDVRLQEEAAFGGGSEPTSPTGKRPSVEIPGAYALGSIDPSLYKIADEDDDYDVPRDHIGRIWFAVEYERETEKLLVTLIKAKNLPSRVLGNDNGCDPFVRLYLMPDERRYLQSKFRKKTCNPKFEESYVFQVNSRTIDDRVLKLTVYDVDRHKRHNVIGHALYPLRDHDCLLEGRLVVWRDLEREVSETTSDRGEILVSLSYNNHLERLTVSVFEGKTFKRVDGVTTVDSYAKVSLMIQNKMVKSKKTEVVKKSTSPTYNESFTFKLPVTSLDTASITLTAMQYYSGHKDKAIGRVVLGSFMFARGKELDHWNEMVANQKEQVSHWHVLS
ncbi:synaptotagmin-15-like isoform X1 [Haliotis rufescens]|uniref:synaptotagmin-15-like isoform X1 n=1 Tax=Haliotis rufescens TaxID=6454 RepID=UPI001EAFCE0A|nr:synaptotagmin-15-like isoform X1 [Haliotis rufescens]